MLRLADVPRLAALTPLLVPPLGPLAAARGAAARAAVRAAARVAAGPGVTRRRLRRDNARTAHQRGGVRDAKFFLDD